jgi:DNA-binding transcriptional LysR family regulator
MLDGVTLDQLRTFIAAVDEGSFSAAGRKLRRAQSVVSQTLANLEGQIGVKLFDRSGRMPVLTQQGQALLADARSVAGGIDLLKAHAKGLAGGLEAELSIVIDVMFPMGVLTEAVAVFHATFPLTPLRLYVESLGALIEPLLDGRCMLGVIGPISHLATAAHHRPIPP